MRKMDGLQLLAEAADANSTVVHKMSVSFGNASLEVGDMVLFCTSIGMHSFVVPHKFPPGHHVQISLKLPAYGAAIHSVQHVPRNRKPPVMSNGFQQKQRVDSYIRKRKRAEERRVVIARKTA